MEVRWTLRSQLIVAIVVTVAAVLTASQWLGERLSTRELDEDLEERSEAVLETVAYLWQTNNPSDLREHLSTLRQARRQVSAIDVFEFGDSVRWVATTRSTQEVAEAPLPEHAVQRLKLGETFRTNLPARAGVVPRRLSAPLVRDGKIVGAVRIEVWPLRLTSLQGQLRRIHLVLMIASLAGIVVSLSWFFDRRVGRKIAALSAVMVRATRGDLHARAAGEDASELGVLATGFNRMLNQIETLTTGLQSRVEEATAGLARKNQELEELTETLRRAQLEAARRQPLAAVGQIASTLAHELGTPLNSVRGYTQLLLRQEMPKEQRDKLTIIDSQITRMIETIQRVLDRTRTHTLPRAPVEVAPLVDEVLGFLGQRIAEADLRVTTHIPADLPLIQGDAVGLRQILVNLMTNAIDATEPHGTISVRAAVIPANGETGRWLEIAVADSGRGLPPDELERIFEPFYTTKEPGTGTGLGLAIVSQIAADHRGRTAAESRPGLGTTIRVQIPLES